MTRLDLRGRRQHGLIEVIASGGAPREAIGYLIRALANLPNVTASPVEPSVI
jgi:hypothetical protein